MYFIAFEVVSVSETFSVTAKHKKILMPSYLGIVRNW